MTNQKPDKFAVVLTGGGAIGAYQVGVIKYIYEKFGKPGQAPFEIFTGISCGALNATFLATYASHPEGHIEYLENLWRSFHVPAYHSDLGRILIKSILGRLRNPRTKRPWSLFDPGPLYDIIHNGFDRDQLEYNFATGVTRGLAIAATELERSIPVWFMEGPDAVEWNAYHSLAIKSRIQKGHVAASCSIPLVLPPVKLESQYFIDGGIRLVKPLAAAVGMGANKILCIRTNAVSKPQLPVYDKKFRPGIGKVITNLVNAVTYDHTFTEIEQIRRLREESQPNSEQWALPYDSEEKQANIKVKKPIDVFSVFPTTPPSHIYQQFRDKLKLTGQRSRHEFMFHREFLGELIKYGYEDAQKREHALENFFHSDENSIIKFG